MAEIASHYPAMHGDTKTGPRPVKAKKGDAVADLARLHIEQLLEKGELQQKIASDFGVTTAAISQLRSRAGRGIGDKIEKGIARRFYDGSLDKFRRAAEAAALNGTLALPTVADVDESRATATDLDLAKKYPQLYEFLAITKKWLDPEIAKVLVGRANARDRDETRAQWLKEAKELHDDMIDAATWFTRVETHEGVRHEAKAGAPVRPAQPDHVIRASGKQKASKSRSRS